MPCQLQGRLIMFTNFIFLLSKNLPHPVGTALQIIEKDKKILIFYLFKKR